MSHDRLPSNSPQTDFDMGKQMPGTLEPAFDRPRSSVNKFLRIAIFISGFCCVAGLGIFGLRYFSSPKPIPIGYETTRIEAPISADGRIDFEAATNEFLARQLENSLANYRITNNPGIRSANLTIPYKPRLLLAARLPNSGLVGIPDEVNSVDSLRANSALLAADGRPAIEFIENHLRFANVAASRPGFAGGGLYRGCGLLEEYVAKVLASRKLDESQLRKLQQLISAHALYFSVDQFADQMERYQLLDCVQFMHQFGVEQLIGHPINPFKESQYTAEIHKTNTRIEFVEAAKDADASDVMQTINFWMDKCVDSLDANIPLRQRRQRFLEFKGEFRRFAADAKNKPSDYVAATLLNNPEDFCGINRIESSFKAYFDAQIGLQLMQIGIGLERFRLKYGSFPRELSTLCPEFLDSSLLEDKLTNKPLKYKRRKGSHVLVYSFGWDRKNFDGDDCYFWFRYDVAFRIVDHQKFQETLKQISKRYDRRKNISQ